MPPSYYGGGLRKECGFDWFVRVVKVVSLYKLVALNQVDGQINGQNSIDNINSIIRRM